MLKKIFKWTLYFASFVAVILFAFYVYLATLNGKPAEEYKVFTKEINKPLVMAHRGGRGIAPENTLAAFQKSFELGVDVLELDVHATKDGELVVIHDKSVDRTTNGKGLIAEMNLNEIQKLDAGFRWTNDNGKTFPFRGQGIIIPTLRKVFQNFPEIQINIEPKHETPSPTKYLCSLIREFKRSDSVIVGSFSDKILEDFRTNCKEVATSASPSEASGFLARYEIGLAENYTPKMQALQVPQSIGSLQFVTKEYVKAAHEQNLEVHVWTINKTEDMKRLIEIGVDGIMTDYPDRLLDLLGK
ncbi:MAG: glycerophosphodiester phosphodiesterase [Aridibacter sp.]